MQSKMTIYIFNTIQKRYNNNLYIQPEECKDEKSIKQRNELLNEWNEMNLIKSHGIQIKMPFISI